MSFNTNTGALTGTPTNSHVGSHCSSITASDGNGGSVTDTFSVSVSNVNDAPTVANAISDVSTAEDASYSLSVANVCTDVDSGDSLTIQLVDAPSTMDFWYCISGTPLNADVGTHTITVTCTDDGTGTLSASDEYVLTVTNVNDAPTIANAISDVSTAEDASYSLSVANVCTDVDSGDSLTYSISGAPGNNQQVLVQPFQVHQ